MAKARNLQVHSIEPHAKSLESFRRKAGSSDDRGGPRYVRPLEQITDLAGVRVIAYFLSDVTDFGRAIEEQFDVVERSDKSDVLEEEERFGYKSVHFLVKLRHSRTSLIEYAPFSGLTAEIQVRTVLQHAWAEIEHDIQYKATQALPREIRRRFMSLAGMLEVADREFAAIEFASADLRRQALDAVQSSRFAEVEITPEALKAYLDQKYGGDGRMKDWAYGWTARLLTKLGFETIEQVDKIVSDYNDDQVSRIVYSTRQGQLSRFELVLLAALGDKFIVGHPFYKGEDDDDWFVKSSRKQLERLRLGGIEPSSLTLTLVPSGADLTAGATPLAL